MGITYGVQNCSDMANKGLCFLTADLVGEGRGGGGGGAKYKGTHTHTHTHKGKSDGSRKFPQQKQKVEHCTSFDSKNLGQKRGVIFHFVKPTADLFVELTKVWFKTKIEASSSHIHKHLILLIPRNFTKLGKRRDRKHRRYHQSLQSYTSGTGTIAKNQGK